MAGVPYGALAGARRKWGGLRNLVTTAAVYKIILQQRVPRRAHLQIADANAAFRSAVNRLTATFEFCQPGSRGQVDRAAMMA